jgi:hypothetical protein
LINPTPDKEKLQAVVNSVVNFVGSTKCGDISSVTEKLLSL